MRQHAEISTIELEIYATAYLQKNFDINPDETLNLYIQMHSRHQEWGDRGEQCRGYNTAPISKKFRFFKPNPKIFLCVASKNSSMPPKNSQNLIYTPFNGCWLAPSLLVVLILVFEFEI